MQKFVSPNSVIQMIMLDTKSKTLNQIAWCPTRVGVIASINKDEKTLRVWDIKPTVEQMNLTMSSTSFTPTKANNDLVRFGRGFGF